MRGQVAISAEGVTVLTKLLDVQSQVVQKRLDMLTRYHLITLAANGTALVKLQELVDLKTYHAGLVGVVVLAFGIAQMLLAQRMYRLVERIKQQLGKLASVQDAIADAFDSTMWGSTVAASIKSLAGIERETAGGALARSSVIWSAVALGVWGFFLVLSGVVVLVVEAWPSIRPFFTDTH